MTSLALPPYNPVISRPRPLINSGTFQLSSRQSGHEVAKECVSVIVGNSKLLPKHVNFPINRREMV